MKRAITLAMALFLLLVACAPAATPTPERKPLRFFAAFPTPKDEPWVGVVDEALTWAQEQGWITYDSEDDIGYEGRLDFFLRAAAEEGYDAIFVDAFLQEKLVREVAADYPNIPFILGSEGGPVNPNVSVFDNWVQDPACLAGVCAGGMTESNEIGIVAAMEIGEVNRIINAFTFCAQMVNPQATIRTVYIGSWFDIAAANEASRALIDQGADVLFAERAGVIEVACEEGLWAIGNMKDQHELCPERVLTSVTWSMRGTVKYVIEQILADSYTAQDLKDFNMMFKGGAALAPFHNLEEVVAARTVVVEGEEKSLLDYAREIEAGILSGTFRVPIDESPPPAVAGPVE